MAIDQTYVNLVFNLIEMKTGVHGSLASNDMTFKFLLILSISRMMINHLCLVNSYFIRQICNFGSTAQTHPGLLYCNNTY